MRSIETLSIVSCCESFRLDGGNKRKTSASAIRKRYGPARINNRSGCIVHSIKIEKRDGEEGKREIDDLQKSYDILYYTRKSHRTFARNMCNDTLKGSDLEICALYL